MKKILITILFISLAAISFAQNKLSVEGGYLPTTGAVDWTQPIANDMFLDNVLYIAVDAQFTVFRYMYIGGSITTWMLPNASILAFMPFYTAYSFDAGLKIENITIGYQHVCTHGVNAIGYVIDPLMKFDSNLDKVFVKIEWEF